MISLIISTLSDCGIVLYLHVLNLERLLKVGSISELEQNICQALITNQVSWTTTTPNSLLFYVQRHKKKNIEFPFF